MADLSGFGEILLLFAGLIGIILAVLFLLWIYNIAVELMGMENSKWNLLGKNSMKAIPLLMGIGLMIGMGGVPVEAGMNALGVETQYEGFDSFKQGAKATGLTVGSDYVLWHDSDGETTKYFRLFTASSVDYSWTFNPGADSNGGFSVALQAHNGTTPSQAEAAGATVNAFANSQAVDDAVDTDPILDIAIIVLLVTIFLAVAKSVT